MHGQRLESLSGGSFLLSGVDGRKAHQLFLSQGDVTLDILGCQFPACRSIADLGFGSLQGVPASLQGETGCCFAVFEVNRVHFRNQLSRPHKVAYVHQHAFYAAGRCGPMA